MTRRRFFQAILPAASRAMLLAALVNSTLAQTTINGLNSSGPDPEFAQKLSLFGQFVGDWQFDLVTIHPDGKRVKGAGEWHFGWVLEGRAVQDVWIARDDVSTPNAPVSEWGTTLRFYDPKTDAWRVVWAGPRRESLLAFVAKQSAGEIVMELDYIQGLPRMNPTDSPPIHRGQWLFDQIKRDSFHWRSVISHDGGKTWQLQSEMFVRRVKSISTGAPE